MSEHIYKTIELTGTSPESIEAAVATAVHRASETLHNLRWYHVSEIRGDIDGNQISHWQVTVKLGFTLEDNPVD